MYGIITGGWLLGLIGFGASIGFLRKEYANREIVLRRMAENERHFRALFDEAPMAYLSMDADGGQLTANQACAQLLGRDVAEISQLHLDDLLASAANAEARPTASALANSDTPQLIGMCRKDGSVMQVLVHARESKGVSPSKRRVHCMLQDVTARQKAEAALEASERRFRMITRNAPDIIWIYNLATDVLDYVSPAIETVLGYKPEEVVGRSLFTFLTPACQAYIKEALPKRLQAFVEGDHEAARKTQDLELRSASGRDLTGEVTSTIVTDENNRPVSILGSVRDISVQRAREAALAALLQCTTGRVGEEYAVLLVKELARVLKLEFVLLSRRIPGQPERFQSVAFHVKGRMMDKFEYDIRNTPCSTLAPGSVCRIASGAVDHYPESLLLKQLKVSGLLSVPLVSSRGEILGSLTGMSTKALPPSETDESLLTVFASQAAAEFERTEALESLAESESRFRKIIENSQAGYFRIGSDRRYEDVNRAWLSLHGYSAREEIIGQHFSVANTLEDLPAATAMIERLFTGYQQPPGEATRRRKNGSVGYHTLSASNVRQGGAVVAVEGFIIDNTALRQAREDYARLFREMPNAFAVHDIINDAEGNPVDFRFIAINPAFENTLNVSAAEATGKRASELFGDLDPYWIETYGKVAMEGTAVNFERQLHERVFSVSAFQVSPGRFASILLDVTERKQAEAALARDEAELQAINAHLPLMLFLLDSEGIIRRFNRAAATYVECDEDSKHAKTLGEIFRCIHAFESPLGCGHGDSCRSCSLNSSFSDTLLHGTAHHRREVNLRVVRGEKVSDVSILFSTARLTIGDEKLVLLCLEDVTPQKQAQVQLQRQAALLDIAHDAICVLSADYAIEYWNRGAETIFGWTEEEALGCDWETLVFKQESPAFREAWTAVIETGEWMGELQALTKSGEIITLQCRVNRVDEKDKAGGSALFVCTNITEAKAMEAQLVHMQRFDTLGSIASGVAHDLNNILSPILMSADLLPSRLSAPEDGALVEMLRTSAKRGAEIVQQLLVFSRGSNMPRQELDPARLVNEMAGIVRQTFPHNILLQVEVNECHSQILADSTQIHQVLLNLCVNARDAMEEKGGVLTLRVEDTLLTGLGRERSSESWVLFTISDTGSGIPPEHIEKIFNPFFSTKPEGKGTGLGLSTAMGIVKSHGGHIRVQSTPGEGSQFLVYLPVLNSEEKQPEVSPEGPEGHGETILIIDDDDSVQHMIGMGLQTHNYRVLRAPDGAQGVALYSKHGSEIRLAVTDMMMPHMDGKLTIQCLRRFDPTLPIIAISGSSEQKAAIESQADPHLHFALKPFTMKKMLALIRSLLDESGPRTP